MTPDKRKEYFDLMRDFSVSTTAAPEDTHNLQMWLIKIENWIDSYVNQELVRALGANIKVSADGGRVIELPKDKTRN